jgi:hypothetical protein
MVHIGDPEPITPGSAGSTETEIVDTTVDDECVTELDGSTRCTLSGGATAETIPGDG